MSKVALLTTTLIFAIGLVSIGVPRTATADNHGVTVTVKGNLGTRALEGSPFI